MDRITPGYNVTIPGRLSDQVLIIPGQLPGLNEYIDENRRHAQKGAKMKKDAQQVVGWSILAQLRRHRFTGPVFLLFTFYEKDRRRDHDNVSSFARKVIQDALVDAGTLQDDGWNHVTGYMDEFKVDAKHPHILVQFIEQEVEQACKQRQSKSCGK